METYTNEDGTWEVREGAHVLVEPSQAWLAARQTERDAEAAAPPPPSETEFEAIKTRLTTDWQASEDAWATLTAAQRDEHLRQRSNATRAAIAWLYKYVRGLEV